MITIQCNGQARELEAGASVADLVQSLDLGKFKFAVELNKQVVSRERLAEVTLQQGDEVNVVTLVGGG